ncbi:amidase signature domain-containing protein [Hygrophoropsis aurantiaca]|uniref:Amidase signature domain-containing protein n=1 Tax=Hygrophoropsis aurantiaca TaxID=72124 RepID=A0ACB8A5J4_9AGAM|nr:amidase signature domain-containing protein [Hygrophoropsis aurantiaca]
MIARQSTKTQLTRPNYLRTCGISTECSTRRVLDTKNVTVNAMVSFANHTPKPAAHSRINNLTVAVKDNICAANLPTTCSSSMLRAFTPPFDATVVELLKNAGADIVGKTNCDEFGMGSLNVNSIHGPVINPFKTSEGRSAGGSSGGSAAAVAAGICDAALGTDTGGSVRLPASYCGVVGLKPSYGLISRWGVISYADSLDCVGVFGKNVDIVNDIFNTVSVFDSKDPTSATAEIRMKADASIRHSLPHFDENQAEPNLSALRIGIPQESPPHSTSPEYFPTELDSTILDSLRRVIKRLQNLGATIVPVSLPSTPYALSAYYVIASAEASSNLARYDGIQYGRHVPLPVGADKTKPAAVYAYSRSAGFGNEVRKRLLLGTYALSADAFDNYFLQAQRVRKLIRSDFNAIFRAPDVLSSLSALAAPTDGVDALLHPSAIQSAPLLPPPKRSQANADDNKPTSAGSGLDTYLQDILTVPASLAGLPALSVPAGSAADGWPVGVSVVGQWGCDDLVLRMGRVIEKGSA